MTGQQRHQSDFTEAPSHQGGKNPFLGVLEGLVRQCEEGNISPQLEASVIRQAQYYAKRNKLSFTPTLRGAILMVQHADAQHRMHMAALDAANRLDYKPEITGYDKATGWEA
jgi:hypothetical protein